MHLEAKRRLTSGVCRYLGADAHASEELPSSGVAEALAQNMETHVLPNLGNRPLQQLTAPMLNTLYSGLMAQGTARGPLAPKTVRYIHATIHKAVSDAVEAGILVANVAERAKPPRLLAAGGPKIECREPVELLRRHRARQQAEREQWGADYADRDVVVCKENGEPLHPQSFSQAFGRIVERAGLRRIRLHDLRHTHATIAVKAGVPVKVISGRLGTESPAFTLKQYAHVLPGMQAEAAALIAGMVATG